MKKRSPLMATLLSLFIPGYMIYWLYDIGKTMQAKSVKVPSILLLFSPILFSVLVMLALAPVYGKVGSNGANSTDLASGYITGLRLLIFPGVAVVIALVLFYYYKFCEAVETTTDHALSKGILLILFLLVSPVAVFLIQEKLNSLDAAGISPHPGAPPPASSPIQ